MNPLLPAALILSLTPVLARAGELPDAIAAKDASVVLRVHAEGAQIYECKADASNKLVWMFREPIATLIEDGTTVGRHFAGPTWDVGGSAIVGKVAGTASGATVGDIPWLKLEVIAHKGQGALTGVTTVQRINTVGGYLGGGCSAAATFRSVAYAADYVFLGP